MSIKSHVSNVFREKQSSEVITFILAVSGFLTCPSEILKTIGDKVDQLSSWENISVEDTVIFSSANENIAVNVVCRPTASSFSTALNNLITPPASADVPVYAAIVYAGLIAEGSGHLVLPSYVFTPKALSDQIEALATAFPKPTDAENQPAHKAIHLHLAFSAVPSGGEWRHLVGHPMGPVGGHAVHVSVNRTFTSSKTPKPVASGDTATPPACDLTARFCITDISKLVDGILTSLPPECYACATEPLIPRNWTDPTLKVSRPCLYVFPEGSGQAAIFAIPGYNLLVNAGCAHHPSFWPVANHLDRLDAVLLTHWGVDNLLGLSSVLPVVFARPIDSVPDSTLCLLTPPPNPNGLYKLPDPNPNQSPLAMSIPREIAKLMGELKQQGTNVFTQTLTRGTKMTSAAQPVQLFQKVGQGCLELSSLTPTDDDSAELRKVTDDWAKASPALLGASVPLGRSPPANKFTVPLLSHTSASTLVVWKPSRDTEAILRILFVAPNAHQARVLVSLEAIAASNIYLRHARAVPSDYERKRSTATAPGHTRRSVLPGLSVASSKPTSLIGAGSAPAKSTAGRLSTLSEKKLAPGRTGVPQNRSSTKPESTAGKKESTPNKASNVSVSGVKKTGRTIDALPTSLPSIENKIDANEVLSLAAETVVIEADQTENDHADIQQTGELHSSAADIVLMENHHMNGYKSELNGTSADVNGKADDALNGLVETIHPATKNPFLSANPLADDLMQLNLSSDLRSDEQDPFHMSPDAHADEPIDPISAWGEPQGLPAPPPGAPINVKSVPMQQPGYTDASSHGIGPGSTKLPPYDKLKPIYVDVAYVPGGGNPHLVDAEWFKRVRARYYVASDPRPGAALMEALTVGKESWTGDDSQLSASLILAHETEELMIWLGRNAGRLAACHLDLTAVASRSSIQLLNEQQTASAKPLTCAGYRIDF
ncbi:Microtubule-associated protein 1A [Fasciolopsis buskii]|uniref:Microtubule-associated protein 1A n=1 Tax=Fasciolopsis buskii TaxID=27845 RepID=A0A8E0RUY7_9TREM|nr:Microtubule-associated protein 1A [Fasciolopsis buski]